VPSGVPLIEVTRGPLVESVHSVAACVADARGDVKFSLGDIEAPVYLRSAAKPFIAAAIVEAGTAERFGFDARELAVITASHDGEPFHVEAVRGILAKIGLDESALRCGASQPSSEADAASLNASGAKPSPVYNNCSGKHAGILALCVHLGLDTASYLDAAHPAQQLILEFCGRMTGDAPETFLLGVDGCGIPVFATSLRRAARAFARFATLEGIPAADARALRTVREAMIAEPLYVGGTKRFDSALIAATQGSIVAKGGAEGVHADALVPQGLGLVLKVVDGNRRATPPAALSLLGELRSFSASESAVLERFVRPEVRNVAGRVVGVLRARIPDTISRVGPS
jgi:L-asparaginase II